MKTKKNFTVSYALVQASFWMDLCIALSFCSVYMQGLGYSNSELGIVIAAGNLLGAVIGPGLSSLIDRKEEVTASKVLPPILAIRMFMLIVLVLHPVAGTSTVVGYTLYIAFAMSVNSLDLKLYVDAAYSGVNVDYGISRAAGSFAYVIISLMLGTIVSHTSVIAIPAAAITVGLIQFIVHKIFIGGISHSGLHEKRATETGVSLVQFAKENKRFCIMLGGTILLFFSHNVTCNFLINITNNLGGNAGSMGVLNGFMAAVEIPVMLFFTRFLGKKDTGNLLRIAYIMLVVKAAAIALAGSIPMLFAAFLLQAPSYGLYTAAIVPYIEKTISHEDSAKAQSLAFTMTTFASVLSGTVGGRLYDTMSVTSTLWIAAAVCAVGAIISISGIQNSHNSREGATE